MVLVPDLSRKRTPIKLTSSLSLISKSYTLRCDARQAEMQFLEFDKFISSVEHFNLGDYLPKPLVKGNQPHYIESLEPEGVPVISTIIIQRLGIQKELCRYITFEDFEAMDDNLKPKKNDILLTMDGGTSIGKPVLFDFDEEYAIDSHVAVLRPLGIDPRYVVYLLASPLGQIQFKRAESGASGQTSVTEEDIRRFRFPSIENEQVITLIEEFQKMRSEISRITNELTKKEEQTWISFYKGLVDNAKILY